MHDLSTQKMLKSSLRAMWSLLGSLIRIHVNYAQKSLEWSCLCAGCIKKETGCTGASTADTLDFQHVTDGVHGHVQVGENEPNMRWSLGWSVVHTTRQKLMTLMNWSSIWRGLEQSVISDMLSEWCKCLHACVCISGGHFKHLRWLSSTHTC